jgi:protein phosphatase 1G
VNFVLSGLAKGLPPHEIAASMLDACLANDPKDACGIGCDNMTCVIVLFKTAGSDES